MTRLRRSRRAAWIALLAIAALVFGPTVSRALASTHAADAGARAHCEGTGPVAHAGVDAAPVADRGHDAHDAHDAHDGDGGYDEHVDHGTHGAHGEHDTHGGGAHDTDGVDGHDEHRTHRGLGSHDPSAAFDPALADPPRPPAPAPHHASLDRCDLCVVAALAALRPTALAPALAIGSRHAVARPTPPAPVQVRPTWSPAAPRGPPPSA